MVMQIKLVVVVVLVLVLLSSSFSHYFLRLITLSRCKFHEIVFFNAFFPNFHKHTVLTFAPVLTQKSQGMQVVRTFNAKTSTVALHFLFHDFDNNIFPFLHVWYFVNSMTS